MMPAFFVFALNLAAEDAVRELPIFALSSAEQDPRYPLRAAFDSDPSTTWVVKGQVEIAILPAQDLVLSFLPGYTKSKALYRANERVAELRASAEKTDGTWTEETVVKIDTRWEDDALPWRAVSIEGGPYQKVRLLVSKTEVEGARSKDVCVPELRIEGKVENPPRAGEMCWSLPVHTSTRQGSKVSDFDEGGCATDEFYYAAAGETGGSEFKFVSKSCTREPLRGGAELVRSSAKMRQCRINEALDPDFDAQCEFPTASAKVRHRRLTHALVELDDVIHSCAVPAASVP